MIWAQCLSCKTMVSAPQGGQVIRCGHCGADVPMPEPWQTQLSRWIVKNRPLVLTGLGIVFAALVLCSGISLFVASRSPAGKGIAKRHTRGDLHRLVGKAPAEVSAMLGEPEHIELVGQQPRVMSYEEYSNQVGLASLRGDGAFRWHYKNVTRGGGAGGKDEWALLTIENDKVVRVEFVEVDR